MRGNKEFSGSQFEYFVWQSNQTSDHKNRLICFDREGTRFEKEVKEESIATALGLFTGSLKSVQRTSGGRVNAEPYQLVLFEAAELAAASDLSVKVKVRFKDFAFQPGREISELKWVNLTKVIDVKHLSDPFELIPEGPKAQTFGIDFGRGVVPIHVVHVEPGIQNEDTVYFIEPSQLEAATRPGKRSRIEIRLYQVMSGVIRKLDTEMKSGSISEFEKTMQRYRTFPEGTSIPLCLQFGSAVITASGTTPHELRDRLKRHVQQKLYEQDTGFSVLSADGKSLVPFGVFEK